MTTMDADDRPWLFFDVGPCRLAVDAARVDEILELGAVTVVPLAPPAIAGLLDLRGEALPLLDLSVHFALDGVGPRDTVLAVRNARYRVGLMCTRARGVRAVSPDAIAPPRLAQPDALRSVARGELDADAGLRVLLDLDALLESARVRG